MDISSVGAGELTPEIVQAQYAVKLIKMAQETMEVTGNIIEDTVDFSQEAMQKYMAEKVN